MLFAPSPGSGVPRSDLNPPHHTCYGNEIISQVQARNAFRSPSFRLNLGTSVSEHCFFLWTSLLLTTVRIVDRVLYRFFDVVTRKSLDDIKHKIPNPTAVRGYVSIFVFCSKSGQPILLHAVMHNETSPPPQVCPIVPIIATIPPQTVRFPYSHVSADFDCDMYAALCAYPQGWPFELLQDHILIKIQKPKATFFAGHSGKVLVLIWSWQRRTFLFAVLFAKVGPVICILRFQVRKQPLRNNGFQNFLQIRRRCTTREPFGSFNLPIKG